MKSQKQCLALEVKVAQLCPTLCNSMDYTWKSPGQNTGVGSLSLLQGIFPTLELNEPLKMFNKYWSFPLSCCCYSVAQSCPALCDPMDCSTPGFLVLHYLPECAQTHVHIMQSYSPPSWEVSIYCLGDLFLLPL